MSLAFKTKTYNVVYYGDLENFVEKLTGLPWSMQQQGDGMHNGSYLIIIVDGESELFDVDDEENIEKWLNSPKPETYQERLTFVRDNYITPEMMLHHLFVTGHIPAGEYLIEVWW